MKKVLIFLLLTAFTGRMYSQVTPQTGSAGYSVPMFSWQDDKSRLNSAVGLSYSSGSGLKVNDLPSNVGQGWSLSAGGVISRMQAGEPDDQKPYFQGGTEQWNDLKKYPAGYLYAGFDITKGVSTNVAYYPLFSSKNVLYKPLNDIAADKELDRFAFQFNGRAGMFVLNKTTGMGEMLGDSKVKIQFVLNEGLISQQIRTTIDKFIITDENGIKYTFAAHGTAKVLKMRFCDQNFTTPITQPTFKGNKRYLQGSFEDANIVNPYIINNWYLTEEEDLLTHRKITFSYTSHNIVANAGYGITCYAEKDYAIVTSTTSKTTTQEITSIVYPDGHQVNFNYDAAHPRFDLPGDLPLASVDVLYSGRYISKYELKTSYFILNRCGTPATDYQKSVARLCLKSVKKSGPDLKADNPPTVFDYYMGSSVADDVIPPPFTLIKDVWGYYNGDYSREIATVSGTGTTVPMTTLPGALNNAQLKGLCFMRQGRIFGGSGSITTNFLNVKPGYAKNGLLKQITFPTGGAMQFEYAQNETVLAGVTTTVGGVHVSKTSVTDGGYSNDCNHKIETSYSYTNTDATASLWGINTPVNSIVTSSYYEPKHQYFYYKFPFGLGCKYTYTYPGILSQDQAMDLTGHQKFMQTMFAVLSTVGDVMTVIDIVNLCVTGTVLGVVLDVIGIVINIAITCLGDPTKSSTSTTYYNSDIYSGNALPAQFKRVVVTESSGGNGKTVMEFTNPDDYALWEPTNPSLSMVQRFAPWAYGLPKLTTVYDAAGNKVKETQNSYDFSMAQRQTGPSVWIYDDPNNPKVGHYYYTPLYPCCKYLITNNASRASDAWMDPSSSLYPNSYTSSSNGNMIVKIYDIYSGRVELRTTYERTYKQSDPSQYAQNITSYFYDPLNYQVNSIQQQGSDGTTKNKTFTYSCDYSSGILNTLNANNIVSAPVVTSSFVNYKHTGETVSEYTTLGNGNIVPYRKLERRLSAPFTGTWTDYAGAVSGSDDPVYKETQLLTYDAAGNLIGMQDEGNRTVTNIYDYSDKYVTASVVNAVPVTDKAAYTSFETSSFGGWGLSGTASYSNTAITGARSLSMGSGNSLTAVLNTAKPYRLSFWATSGVTVSSGATLIKSAPLINGFTYYEYNVAQGTSSVAITGTTTIDELRLYPQTARMRTVTYDPIIGKTSECDENNRTTYYEYDDLGRLRFIKDDQKNTVKMYEYNMAKKAVCPVLYSNLATSELFTTNNCGAGYIGGPVIYTIPAGTYTSTISQDIVDQQVANDLLQNGQNYANSHPNCLALYSNVAKAQDFVKDDCPEGYTGSTVTYTVPAGKYTSTISQDDADEQAQNELDGNGQYNANATGTCVISYDADWIGTGVQYCSNGHNMVQVKDMNPNSSTYNQTQYIDQGEGTCTVPTYAITNLTPCNGGISSTYNIAGHAGDLVTLKLTFTGIIQWSGYGPYPSARIATFVAASQSATAVTPAVTTTTPYNFSLVRTLSFVMPTDNLTVYISLDIDNSITNGTSPFIVNPNATNKGAVSNIVLPPSTGPNSALLEVTSVNNTAKSTSAVVCYGYTNNFLEE